MTRLVLDTSVCLKWFLHERGDEPDSEIALDLHARTRSGNVELFQPALWHAEVAAGLARMLPDRARTLVEQLHGVEVTLVDDASSMLLATGMAIDLRHHLFDTIYHAVAIDKGARLVTADEHYYRKAHTLGHIVLLRDWRAPSSVAEEPAPYLVRTVRKSPARVRRKRRQ